MLDLKLLVLKNMKISLCLLGSTDSVENHSEEGLIESNIKNSQAVIICIDATHPNYIKELKNALAYCEHRIAGNPMKLVAMLFDFRDQTF